MKKWFVIAILAGAVYFFAVHTDTGRHQWKLLTQHFDQLTEKAATATTTSETKVYKIQNPDGSWSFSNQKPQDDNNVTEQTYRSDTNVMPPAGGKQKQED